MAAEHIPNTAVWADGGGTTFWATAEAIREREVDFEIGLVITADPKAEVLDRVRDANAYLGMDIETMVLEGKPGRRQTPESEEKLLEAMSSKRLGNLTLMGCLVFIGGLVIDELNGNVPETDYPHDLEGARKLLGPGTDESGYYLPEDFPDLSVPTAHFRVRNTHPAPTIWTAKTYGEGASLRVVKLRGRQSAHTVHVAGKGIDSGPTIAVHKFPALVPPLGSSEEVEREFAARNFKRARKVEKAHLPVDLDKEFKDQTRLAA